MNTPFVVSPASMFTAGDRCDRCSAPARLLVLLHAGGQLLFCGHHGQTHRSALSAAGVLFEDWRGRAEYQAA